MAKANVQFTKDNEYYTPKSFVDRFGKFDYDPATTKEKAEEFEIQNYDTIDTDGLSKDWTQYERIWINPPFTRKHEFLLKAQETYQSSKNEIYILFPIEFITTARFHNAVRGGQDIRSERSDKFRKRTWKERKFTSIRKCSNEASGHLGDGTNTKITMNDKSKEQLMAIIEKQEEYITHIEKAENFVITYFGRSGCDTCRALREEISRLKS